MNMLSVQWNIRMCLEMIQITSSIVTNHPYNVDPEVDYFWKVEHNLPSFVILTVTPFISILTNPIVNSFVRQVTCHRYLFSSQLLTLTSSVDNLFYVFLLTYS